METILSVVTRARSGDESAFSEIFSAYYNRVYYFVLHHVKSPQDAEDIVQNTFTEVFKSFGKLSNEAAFKSWLYTIAHRQIGMLYRKNGRSVVKEDLEGVADMLDDNGEFLPDNILESDETKNTVMELIKQLPDPQKSAVLFYYFEEMSVKEIAEIQACSVGTVTSRLNYARRYIKTEIEKCREKGNYVLSVAPVPLLTLLFREMAAHNYLPQETAAKIFAESCVAAGLEASAVAAGGAAGTTAAGSGASFFF
jgi:RNA polymerase sigma factor (sigma-70 family)